MSRHFRNRILLALAVLLTVLLPLNGYAHGSGDTDFTDVDPATPEGKAISTLAEAGYITGTAPGVFSPDVPITAAEYLRMLCLAKGLQPEKPGAAGYVEAALHAGWFDWDEIPPDHPSAFTSPLSRELGANIVVKAFFGSSLSYSFTEESAKISDFSLVGGRYYLGVLGGLSKGIFNHISGTPFYPQADLLRGSACLWVYNALQQDTDTPSAPPSVKPPLNTPLPVFPQQNTAQGGVKQNGWLQVRGTQLCNAHGDPVILHGMSSHGIQWFPQYTNRQSIENTRSYGANIFRVAVYVEEGGYLSDPALMKQRVTEAVSHAVELDMYVIIDWHILQDGNPLTHADAAADFFREMSARYADTPNVIYEICNEPNGNITWSSDVKPYAERMTAVIRANAPKGIILIGSPTWDQDVDQAAADPVNGGNLMYTLHFYAGTHHQALRDKADRALSLGAPLFVSEWGTSAADGSGGVFLASSEEWTTWMQDKSISWCNWSLCDKNESSAALLPGTSPDIIWTDADLSESGKYVFAKFADTVRPPSAAAGISTASALKACGLPENSTWQIEKNGQVLSGEDKVSTGCRLTGDGRQYTLIVFGDVLGTGQINIVQLVTMARVLNGTQELSGPFLRAACLTGSGRVTIADLAEEARLLTGQRPLQILLLS